MVKRSVTFLLLLIATLGFLLIPGGDKAEGSVFTAVDIGIGFGLEETELEPRIIVMADGRVSSGDAFGPFATGISNAIAAGVGELAGCVVTADGGAQCSGENDWGQVGDGTKGVVRQTPVVVCEDYDESCTTPLSGMATIAPGGQHTCSMTAAGTAKCWGDRIVGQLGDGTSGGPGEEALTPVIVCASGVWDGTSCSGGAVLEDLTAVVAGEFHSCALTGSAGVKCWGYNQFGGLGNPSYVIAANPVDVHDLTSGVVSITTSWNHTCAVISGGSLKCWGLNAQGQVGDSTTTDRWVPVDVVGLSGDTTAVAAGGSHTCALISGGTVECWGLNTQGQLGDGTTNDSNSPALVCEVYTAGSCVQPLSGAQALFAGGIESCVITEMGGVKCWGDGVKVATVVPGFGDNDGDGVEDFLEIVCGGDPLDASAIPERIDGAFAGVDDDGDGETDEALPAGAEAYDCDGDGFTGTEENHIYGLGAGDHSADQDPCGTNSSSPTDPPSPIGWPLDLKGGLGSDNQISVTDILSFVAPVYYLNTNVGDNPGDVRWDLTSDGSIDMSDLNAITTGPRAYPPMLGGAQAFNGPLCPWAP